MCRRNLTWKSGEEKRINMGGALTVSIERVLTVSIERVLTVSIRRVEICRSGNVLERKG